MDPFEERCYISPEKIMSLFGLSDSLSYTNRTCRYFLIGFICFHNVLMEICQFFILDLDLRSAAIAIHSFVLYISFICVYWTCIVHFSTIQKLLLYAKEDSKMFQDDAERKIVQIYDRESQIFILATVVLYYTLVAFISLPPVLRTIISGDKGLSSTDPFPMSSCYDYFLDREIYYYPVFIQQIIFEIISFAMGITCYSLYFLYIQHLCTRLSIIKMKIHRPFVCNQYNDVLVEAMKFSDWIIDIIQELSRTNKQTQLLNTVSEKASLAINAMGFVLLIINFQHMFQIPIILEREKGKNDAFLVLFFVIVSLFPLYANSYMGQRLIDRSMEVYRELCVTPIYKLSLKTQKYVLMTILMSAKPFSISVGKFFVTSHELFCNIVKPALSFAMMVDKIKKV